MDIKKDTRPNAEVALSGSLSAKEVEAFWDEALKAITKDVELPGFRKGHVPTERVIQEVGENTIWKEAAERALKEELEDMLKKQDVLPITPLSLSLKSAEKGADVPFEIVATVAPSCTALDYKAAAKKAIEALPAEDTEKEEAEAKKAFRTQARSIAKMSSPDVKEGDAQKIEEKGDEPLTDEEAKPLGFENSKAFEHFLEGEAKKAVADRSIQKKRAAIAEALIQEASCDIPRMIVEEETKALLEATKKDIASRGMPWNDYLKRLQKDESAVLDDIRPSAEKRVSLDIIFGEIVRNEKLELSEDEKKQEDELSQKLVQQNVPEDRARNYVREQIIREKIWELLGVKAQSAA